MPVDVNTALAAPSSPRSVVGSPTEVAVGSVVPPSCGSGCVIEGGAPSRASGAARRPVGSIGAVPAGGALLPLRWS
jgi:hypothetical protein